MMAACATGSNYQARWSGLLPPLGYFEEVYISDKSNQQVQSQDNYLAWVKRFYVGWALYPKGWDWLTATVISGTPDAPKRQHVERDLALLGQKISAEWAKDARYRVINNSHLMVWADALKIAVHKNQQDILTEKLIDDVEQLLTAKLAANEIALERYFRQSVGVVVADELATEDPFDV